MTEKIVLCVIAMLLATGMVADLKALRHVSSAESRRSVDEMSLQQKISLLLLPSHHLENGKIIFPKTEEADFSVWNKMAMINVINGFKTSDREIPFPDIRAIQCVRDSLHRHILREDLMNFMAQNKISGLLASGEYLFDICDRKGLNVPSYNSLALWLAQEREIFKIPVVPLPEKLFIDLQSLGLAGSKNIVINPGMQKVDTPEIAIVPNFEMLVQQGTVFLTSDYQRDFNRLLRAYQFKMLNEELLNVGCKKIMDFLEQSVLFEESFVSIPVSRPFSTYARRIAFEKGIRMFGREDNSFLSANLSDKKIKIIPDASENQISIFFSMAANHVKIEERDSIPADLVVWLYGGKELTDSIIRQRIREIRLQNPESKIALAVGYSGNFFEEHSFPEELELLIIGTSEWPVVWESLAQALFLGMDIERARMSDYWVKRIEDFSLRGSQTRLKFGVPEEVSMLTDSLLKIDTLMLEAIREKALPGGQVVVVRDGVVVWNKAYGYHTYKKTRPVKENDIYDLASITKIAATIPALMKLFDEKKWRMQDTLGLFFTEVDSTEKSSLTIKELLLHESGLASYIPFYLEAIDKSKLKGSLFAGRYSWLYNIKLDEYIYLNRTVAYRKDVFREFSDSIFSVAVAKNWFINKFYLDSMMLQVIDSRLYRRGQYRYSDLGFYFLGELVHRLSNKSLDKYVKEYFYEPLGMFNTSFLPVNHFEQKRIVPTEEDKAFRKQLIHGWVHDPGAAMMGGVAGHAGLFSNALDIAKLMQMYLNGGRYGGKKYLNSGTVKLFTSRVHKQNRRGLGFDKPEPDSKKESPVSRQASLSSFGHSGFTGTLAWADPETEIVYVFLSNRVHPHQYNKKLIEGNYRTRIQDIIYRSIIRYNDNLNEN
ncbi:serine hydrolase domain-containing protein [Thermophagus sp. OGC60D27]|uniref:serine hydrolase domain-containing protein n=1 Tax=Thermophagus sp. OGC60D27 TaxID=3458415 RepID=UPI00403782C8